MTPNTHPLLLLTLLAAGAPPASADPSGRPGHQDVLFAPPPQVVYDAPGDGRLWARGTTYKASFGPEGATYIPFLGSQAPRNQPVRMRLAAARVGERELPLERSATWSRSGERVVLDRGPVDVCYDLDPKAVEQTFLVDAFLPDGDLVVELEVESELELRAAGAGFEWMGEHGGVRYGGATALDADGKSLALESRLEDGGLSIRVPRAWLETARQPVVIDPIITTYAVNAGALATWSGDVAYDATHGMFLHAFTVLHSADDRDVYSVPVQFDGTVRHDLGMWIDVTDANWSQVAVANSNADDNFLVVAEAESGAERAILGRLRQLPGLGVGPVLQISTPGAPDGRLPSVGGDITGGGSSNYCVAWVEEEGVEDRKVRYRILSSTGASVTSVLSLETAPNQNVWRPRVSDSNGVGLSSERHWNVVWMHVDGLDGDIRGAQIAPNGFLTTPPFVIDGRTINHGYPDVSSPLLAPSGGPRDFLVVYTAYVSGQNDLHARLFKGDGMIGSYDLGALEAQVVGDGHLGRSQFWPAVSTDGTQFLVTYTESPEVGIGTDIRMSSFHHNGDDLIANEAHLLVASDPTATLSLPEIASVHDGGVVGAPVAALAWSAGTDQDDPDTHGAIYLRPAGWKPLGDVICAGLPNSSGNGATFRAYGSSLPDDNRLFLDVDNLPLFQWGQFLMSAQSGSTPYGQGFLCLAAPHIRLNSTKQNSWVTGTAGSQLDLGALPQGIAIQPGDSWYFQFWYRDGNSFNFSNALGIDFE